MRVKFVGLSIFMASLLAASAANAITYENGYGWTKAGKKTISELHQHGYHDVEVLYTQPMRCKSGKYDYSSSGFRAISDKNHIVTGVLCDVVVTIKTSTI